MTGKHRPMTPTPSSHRFIPNPTPCGRSRRVFLWEVGGGFAGLALIDLLSRGGFFPARTHAEEPSGSERRGGAEPYLMAPKPAHFPAKAKQVVFLFMNGAPSQ